MPVEGRDLSSRQAQYVVRDLEIGQPINSEEGSETAEGVTRESKGVRSCPRATAGHPGSSPPQAPARTPSPLPPGGQELRLPGARPDPDRRTLVRARSRTTAIRGRGSPSRSHAAPYFRGPG